MKLVTSGDVVRVRYSGTTARGTEFARSDEPSDFEIGAGSLFPVLDAALVGMQVGQTKEVHVPAKEAFGPRRPELVRYVERSSLPDDDQLDVGAVLVGQHPSGQQIEFLVTAIDGNRVQLDANHPLAGEDLVFHFELLEIVSSNPIT